MDSTGVRSPQHAGEMVTPEQKIETPFVSVQDS